MRGKVLFWKKSGEGAIKAEGGLYRLLTTNLTGLAAGKIRDGMDVEFEPGAGMIALNVRDPNAPPPVEARPMLKDLPPDHAVFQKPPVMKRLRELLEGGHSAVAPGLLLDKYLAPVPRQEQQKDRLHQVIEATGSAIRAGRYETLFGRWRGLLAGLGVTEPIVRTTTAPLTLHLSRAAMLENAGIALHPIHGFAYLPATGLKGLAHAYAETIWKPSRPEGEQAVAVAAIARVFGTVTRKAGQGQGDEAEAEAISGAAGTVVFLDAWPLAWPRLIVDVVNNHHVSYYRDGKPPGDWDSPEMVYFLAVASGTSFALALVPRDGLAEGTNPGDLGLAWEWLDGGLRRLGAGAKTAAGYGRLAELDANDRPVPFAFDSTLGRRVAAEVPVRLVTPAFLAGADQSRDDCDLRGASLRGLLRSWWRTLHTGYLDVATLRALESALWGDTQAGGAIGLAVEKGSVRVERYAYKDGFHPKPGFKRDHNLANPPDGKTTQGLFYASYGMDEVKHGQRFSRWYAEPGSWWTLRLDCRAVEPEEQDKRKWSIPAELVLDQARAALALLCRFGGVGSKGRKGFGSLQWAGATAAPDPADCDLAAAELRRHLGLDQEWDAARSSSASLADRVGPEEIETPWTDPWQALDHVGFAYQAFAQQYAHKREKLALGLPRSIHGPMDRPFPHQDPSTHQRSLKLRTADNLDRHASPLHVHLAADASGRLAVRLLALVSPRLPDRATSRAFLTECVATIRDDLSGRADEASRVVRPGPRRIPGVAPARGPVPGVAPAASPPRPAPKPLNKGQEVRGTLHREGEGWIVRFPDQDRSAALTNPGKLPDDVADGTIAFFYIEKADKKSVHARFLRRG